MESTTKSAAEVGNRRALAIDTIEYLRRVNDGIGADLLADLDDDGWAMIQGAMGRARPFSPATQQLIVSLKAFEERLAATEIDDPFEGIV
jgi:hypothetical protein